MKIQYDLFIFWFQRLDYMHENKDMRLYIYIYMFQRKSGILIPDLYFYGIKIQTNIEQNG
jgi:hypothetical protein